MAETFSDQELAFLAAADNTVTLRCCCQFAGHGGFCDEQAAVTIKFHLPHLCKHPTLVESKRIDENGCVTQILCLKCYWEVRQFCVAKLAQTRAMCQALSAICQACGASLRAISGFRPLVLPVCPRCSQPRIQFDPVCGAGVRDKEGNSHGCGHPLNEYTDIIYHEEWMVPQHQGGTP